MNFYIGTFDVQLQDSSIFDVGESHNYARIFTLVITFGVVVIPMVGAMMDTVGYPFTAATTVALGTIWAVLLDLQSPLMLVVSFFFYSMYRTFFFTFFFAYLADTLGFKYFGVLAGISFVLGGVLSFLQVPLANYVTGTCNLITTEDRSACDPGKWQMLNVIMTATIFLTVGFSYFDWKRREAARAEVHAAKAFKKSANTEMAPLNTSTAGNPTMKSSIKSGGKQYGAV